MNPDIIQYTQCPECAGLLAITNANGDSEENVQSGALDCTQCSKSYDVVNHVPRFVPIENDATGFGYQWNKFPKIGYDSYNGTQMSEHRFYGETLWPRQMQGEMILEAGCGAGRYTEQAAKSGATIMSIDYSNAVEANFASNGNKKNVFIMQADINKLPFKKEKFDRIFCFGVLQFTSNVKKSFSALVDQLKPGGSIVIDVYNRRTGLINRVKDIFSLKIIVRPITRHISAETLHKFVSFYTHLMWPLGKLIYKLTPRYSQSINWRLMIGDYWGEYDMSSALLKEMAICDVLDMLQPNFEHPQYLDDVREMFLEAGLENIDVNLGWLGIYGRGTKALTQPASPKQHADAALPYI